MGKGKSDMMIFTGNVAVDSANVILKVEPTEPWSTRFTIRMTNVKGEKGDANLDSIGEFKTREQAQRKLEEIFLQLAWDTCVRISDNGEDVLVQPAGRGY